MADWRKLCKALILADGYIERKETDIIKRELLADGVISKSEAEFLIDLRKSTPRAVAEFHQFVLEVVKKAVLADGDVSKVEAAWLQKFILADGAVDELEKNLLRQLKAEAKSTSPEFDAIYKQHVGA